MKVQHKHIGLDVHKDQNQVAVAERGSEEVRFYGSISNDLHALEKLTRKLGGENVVLHFVYEAGPCGFGIYRRLKQLGIDCKVVAPSLIPKKSGDRVKTNRRDAIQLARLDRAGELTAIYVPDERDEAIRDLCRARTDGMRDQRASRYRLKAFLLRHGYQYQGQSSWTAAHLRYLRELVLPDPSHKIVLEEYLLTITQAGERIGRLDEAIAAAVAGWRWRPVVEALRGMRGVNLLTAAMLGAELGDFSRFAHPRQMMAYLGLVSSEYSTGDHRHQGAITKAGNSHARRLVVEAAQHYRLPPKVSAPLSRRQENLSARVKEISWKAQVRLHKRYWALTRRGKLVQKIQVAIARELVGFIWAVGQAMQPASAGPTPPADPRGQPKVYVLRADKKATAMPTDSRTARTMAQLA
jgi:transposase